MAAGHRGAGQVAKQIAGAAFMGGIAGRKMSGDSIGGDFAFGCVDCLADGRFVKLCLGRAIGSMAAIDEEDRVLAKRAGKISALQRGLVEADHEKADTSADTFDDGVGGKRCRQRDKADIGRAAVEILEDAADGATDADRQVVARGQRLAGRANGSGGGVE